MLPEEENKKTNETGTTVDPNADYLAAIKELKKNSVPLDDYKKLQGENKKLLDSIVNGQVIEQKAQEVVYSDEEINALREKLFNTEKHDLSNLDYAINALELRKAILQKSGGKEDIFVGTHNAFEPDANDYYRAENTAETLKEIIEYAQGDSSIFTTELQRRMKR